MRLPNLRSTRYHKIKLRAVDGCLSRLKVVSTHRFFPPLSAMASGAAEAAAVVADHGALLTELAIVGGADFFSATIKSLVVILVTEIGDKTFFIAAVRKKLNSKFGDTFLPYL
jgi:hypothetical protein